MNAAQRTYEIEHIYQSKPPVQPEVYDLGSLVGSHTIDSLFLDKAKNKNFRPSRLINHSLALFERDADILFYRRNLIWHFPLWRPSYYAIITGTHLPMVIVGAYLIKNRHEIDKFKNTVLYQPLSKAA